MLFVLKQHSVLFPTLKLPLTLSFFFCFHSGKENSKLPRPSRSPVYSVSEHELGLRMGSWLVCRQGRGFVFFLVKTTLPNCYHKMIYFITSNTRGMIHRARRIFFLKKERKKEKTSHEKHLFSCTPAASFARAHRLRQTLRSLNLVPGVSHKMSVWAVKMVMWRVRVRPLIWGTVITSCLLDANPEVSEVKGSSLQHQTVRVSQTEENRRPWHFGAKKKKFDAWHHRLC